MTGRNRSGNSRRRYARGTHALAECQRSGQKMRYRDLVEDGHIPGLLVHPDWYEPRHPQEFPVVTHDPQALYRPSPEISVPAGEFDTIAQYETFLLSDCPPTPQDLRFFESTTLAADATPGDLTFALEDPLRWDTFECLYVELDGGGWFRSKVRMRTGLCTPDYSIGTVIPFAGAASAGNQVFIGTGGSGVPLLDGEWEVDSGAP